MSKVIVWQQCWANGVTAKPKDCDHWWCFYIKPRCLHVSSSLLFLSALIKSYDCVISIQGHDIKVCYCGICALIKSLVTQIHDTHVWDCLQTDGLSMCPHCAGHSKTESCGHYRTTASLLRFYYISHILYMPQTCDNIQSVNAQTLNTLGNNISLWEFSIKNACWMVRIHCDAILI